MFLSTTLNTGLPPALQLLEPDVRAKPGPSERVQMHVFERVLQSDPLGSWAGDPWAQTNHFRDVPYVAIRAFMDAITGATVTAVGRDAARPVRKAMPTPGQQGRDTDYTPLDEEHPLSQVIESPNGEDGAWTMSQELAYIALQAHLTGIAPVWTPFNESGKPVQFFALPSFTTQPIYQAGQNPQYPKGAYRVNPYASGGWYAPGGLSTTTLIPGEEIKRFRFQSPFNRWDGYSPLTAGAITIDILESVDKSRHSAMRKGVRMDAMAVIPGTTQEEADAFVAGMTAKHGGAENHGAFGAIAVPPGMDGGKFSIQTFSSPAREMDYTGSWDQVVGAVLAIFRVPKSVAGLATATSYSELYAALRQFNELALKPFARQLSDFLTKSLAAPWAEKRGALKIQVDLPTLDDPDLLEKQLAADVNIRTVNERRAIRNLEPFPDGDVPEQIWLAKQQQAIAPQPMPGQEAMPSQEQTPSLKGGGENQPADASPEAAQDGITQAALEALGVGVAEPQQPQPDLTEAPEAVQKAQRTKRNEGEKWTVGGQTYTKKNGKIYRVAATAGQRPQAQPNAQGRFPSKHNPGVTYGDAKDRDSDDTYHDRNIARTGRAVEDARGKLGQAEAAHAAKVAHIAALQRQVDEAKAKLQATRDTRAQMQPTQPQPTAPAPQPTPQEDAASQEAWQRVPDANKAAAAKKAQAFAKSPEGKAILQQADAWAHQQAAKHADRVAAKLKCSPQLAQHILANAIKMLCRQALESPEGSAETSLTLNQPGGTKVKLGIQRKGPTSGAVPQPANPAGKGSRPPMAKALAPESRLSERGNRARRCIEKVLSQLDEE